MTGMARRSLFPRRPIFCAAPLCKDSAQRGEGWCAASGCASRPGRRVFSWGARGQKPCQPGWGRRGAPSCMLPRGRASARGQVLRRAVHKTNPAACQQGRMLSGALCLKSMVLPGWIQQCLGSANVLAAHQLRLWGGYRQALRPARQAGLARVGPLSPAWPWSA